MSAVCWAVMVAAGQGSRMGLNYNKAFVPLMGRPMLMRTLDALEQSGLYAGVEIVIGPGDRQRLRELLDAEGRGDVMLVDGGETRQASVLNGLSALPEDCEFVAVHDAARPFVTREVLERTLKSAMEFGSGVACTPINDTVKRVDAQGRLMGTLDRSLMRAVQTPQVFRLETLRQAHEWARARGIDATDDSALVELSGHDVRLVESRDGALNVKLTTPDDLEYAGRALMSGVRTGLGYDAHRLASGRALVLCGVEIPFELGLMGHSDADVATHALIDALLGASGLGDIGRLFPDTDMRYKDISSLELLREVMRRLRARSYAVVNCDMTIVAQRPKLAPYMDEMRRTLARELGVAAECVNVKGKTTEGMGFEGEGRGMSAQCVATLAKYR